MGIWLHSGSPKRSFAVLRKMSGKISNITPVATTNEESTQGQVQVVTLKRVYYVNKSSKDVRKIMSTLEGTVTPIYLCLTTHRLEILEVQFKPPNILTTALYNYILLNN